MGYVNSINAEKKLVVTSHRIELHQNEGGT